MRLYRRAAKTFLESIGEPLQAITLGDVVTYQESRSRYASSTQARTINTLKSLFGFAQRIGYCRFIG